LDFHDFAFQARLEQVQATLIVKMVVNNSTINISRTNYKLLCDVETFLGVACVMPLLGAMQCLTKFA
jgi:hypothetical protein